MEARADPTSDLIQIHMRRSDSGDFRVALRVSEAMDMFPPEGERSWVPGWDPSYAGGVSSESAGTVFTTNVGGVNTIWLIVDLDRVRCVATCARVTPGHHAGTVHVACANAESGVCVVSVTYDMSALPAPIPPCLIVTTKHRSTA